MLDPGGVDENAHNQNSHADAPDFQKFQPLRNPDQPQNQNRQGKEYTDPHREQVAHIGKGKAENHCGENQKKQRKAAENKLRNGVDQDFFPVACSFLHGIAPFSVSAAAFAENHNETDQLGQGHGHGGHIGHGGSFQSLFRAFLLLGG